MENPSDNSGQHRRWYKKKRYIIPIAAIGLIYGLIANNNSSQHSQNNPNSLPPYNPSPKSNTPQEPKLKIPPLPNPTPPPNSYKPSSSCDPNYSGCVPIASDVDCAGGSGDGPAYVSGPITVIGYDKYGLDRDHNGIACE